MVDISRWQNVFNEAMPTYLAWSKNIWTVNVHHVCRNRVFVWLCHTSAPVLISQTSQSWYYIQKILNGKYHKIWKYAFFLEDIQYLERRWIMHYLPLSLLCAKPRWSSARPLGSGKMSLGSSPVRISVVANCRGHSMSQSERNSSVVPVRARGAWLAASM